MHRSYQQSVDIPHGYWQHARVRYGSVCSGIEAATVAWHPLGWQPQWFAEIHPFASRVLAHHYPKVPNLGDFTKITCGASEIDLLVGGTPCQAFSVAGLRGGLSDSRGNLALEFCRLAARTRPKWVVWENVPGCLSSNDGEDFASIIGALAELGYGVCWRVLDAKYTGVPQSRRRVFIVGCLGDPRRSAEVLFNRACVSGDTAPRRKKTDEITPDPSPCLTTRCGRNDPTLEPIIAFHDTQTPQNSTDETPTLGTSMRVGWTVGPRFATPLEWERLQGFPDHYTALEGAKDAARYFVIGNSMAVPVMRWIGERISAVENNP